MGRVRSSRRTIKVRGVCLVKRSRRVSPNELATRYCSKAPWVLRASGCIRISSIPLYVRKQLHPKGAMVAGPPWTLPTVFSRLNGALRMACASRKPTWLEKGAQTENHSESLFPVIESPQSSFFEDIFEFAPLGYDGSQLPGTGLADSSRNEGYNYYYYTINAFRPKAYRISSTAYVRTCGFTDTAASPFSPAPK